MNILRDNPAFLSEYRYDQAREVTEWPAPPPDIWQPSSLAEQREWLLEYFPQLVLPEPVYDRPIESGYDAPAYIVLPNGLGRHYGLEDCCHTNYGRLASEIVFPALLRSCLKAQGSPLARPRHHISVYMNFCPTEFRADYFRLGLCSQYAYQNLAARAQYDAVIAPVSYGGRWQNWRLTPQLTNELMIHWEELTLGCVSAGCLLIAEPRRLMYHSFSQIVCPADECRRLTTATWHRPQCTAFTMPLGNSLNFRPVNTDGVSPELVPLMINLRQAKVN